MDLEQLRLFESQHPGIVIGFSYDTGLDGPSMHTISGCVGGIVAVLTLSAIGFCTR